MKKFTIIGISAFWAFTLLSCGNNKVSKPAEPWTPLTIVTEEIVIPEKDGVPQYTVLEKTQYSLSKFAIDKDGYYILFDGTTFNGWRGYNRDDVPKKWILDDGAIKCAGGGARETRETDGGDLLFGHKFKNFELSVDWKASQGSNSGILYLAREIKGEPMYISGPESQIMDATGRPANRPIPANKSSSSLYDMIAADPQNAKPAGEWNNTTITVLNGNVTHFQNGVKVVEYQLWTPRWTEMIQGSKFKQGGEFPLAFELMNNLGGSNREGYFGLQDHESDIWFRNIKIKIL